MLYGTYDPLKVSISAFGLNIVGVAPGTFIKCSRNEDAYQIQVGADGHATRVRNRNASGRIEITLQHGSPSNAQLAAIAAQDELAGTGIGAVLIRDVSPLTTPALAECRTGWIVKNADMERGKEAGEVTWIIETDDLTIRQTGLA